MSLISGFDLWPDPRHSVLLAIDRLFLWSIWSRPIAVLPVLDALDESG
jgi:hypothetical protein